MQDFLGLQVKNLGVRKLGDVYVFGSKMKSNFDKPCKQSLTGRNKARREREGERKREKEREKERGKTGGRMRQRRKKGR